MHLCFLPLCNVSCLQQRPLNSYCKDRAGTVTENGLSRTCEASAGASGASPSGTSSLPPALLLLLLPRLHLHSKERGRRSTWGRWVEQAEYFVFFWLLWPPPKIGVFRVSLAKKVGSVGRFLLLFFCPAITLVLAHRGRKKKMCFLFFVFF